jgi:hypothetical protein
MSSDRVRQAHQIIQEQLHPGDNVDFPQKLPNEHGGFATFVLNLPERVVKRLTQACHAAFVNFGACTIKTEEPKDPSTSDRRGLWITIDVSGNRAL